MKWFKREKRNNDPSWSALVNRGALSQSGQFVDAKAAESISAVWGCITALSESTACLLLHVYQRNDDGHGAWTWEHQALTRARFCAGDAELGARFERLRDELLARPRDVERLREDVLTMRQKMLDGHPNRSELFDLKHDRGGMVDIEFIVQYLVLANSHRHGDLVRNLGNIALLQMAGGMRLIDMALGREVADAYRTFRRLQHRMRLNGAERARIEPGEVESEAAAVRRLWRDVFGPD